MGTANDCKPSFQERNVEKKRKAIPALLQTYAQSREKMRRTLQRRRADTVASGDEGDQARRDLADRRSSELLMAAFSHND